MTRIISRKGAVVLAGLAVLFAMPERLEAKHHGKRHGEHEGGGQGNIAPDDIKPEVLGKILQDNPGIGPDFLEKEPPDQMIKLSDGKEWPLYQLTQFLHHNFHMDLIASKKEGEKIIEEQNWKMHRLMAHPDFRDWFKAYHPSYKVHGRKVDWEQAYHFVRHLHNTVRCGVTHPGQMPHGGGGHAMAPSWAVWKKLNLLYHEAANATPGFSGDDPVLTGVLAGHLEKMDKKRLWKYPTIDVNTLEVSDDEPPVTGEDSVDKGASMQGLP